MSIGLPDVLGAVMLGALGIYAVTAGADFGGGVWALLATGPRRSKQHDVIESALAPVWEANHVWLIFVVVVLFSAFPRAWSAICVLLYVPLSLVLLGIVSRGAGFVFLQYGYGSRAARTQWGRMFSAASVFTPFFLGTSLAALSGAELDVSRGEPLEASTAWLRPFALLCGAFVTTLFCFLAAVYLAVEARADGELKRDFRNRAVYAGIILGVLSVAVRLSARNGTFERMLFSSWWSHAVQWGVAASAIATLTALWLHRLRIARVFAIVQTCGIVLGWGLAQYPHIILPGLTLQQAAAPDIVLVWILISVLAGTVFLVPALIFLLRIFKAHRSDAAAADGQTQHALS